MALLEDSKDLDCLTLRAITKKAGVGIGLVNYHFKNKENLVREAVRIFVGRAVVHGYGDRRFVEEGRLPRVEAMLLGPMDFLAEYPGLSRISVLFDFSSPAPGDNTDETFRELAKAVAGSFPPGTDRPADLELRIWAVLGAIHEAFLRPKAFAERTGLDYARAEDRAAYAKVLARFLVST